MRIGTRGSALALAQARSVAELAGHDAEIVTITTSGDRGADADKSRWVSELERALIDGRVDLAVHSAKDVPSEMPPGLELVAVPERADPWDVLCGAEDLAELRPGSRIGTSSLRRAAQLRAARADLEIVELRGNVDTRLRRLAEGELEAIVLARAGLERLGRGSEAGAVLDEFVPAAGQGALALQARAESIDAQTLALLTDPPSMECLGVERELVAALGASCNTPLGAHARRLSGDEIELRAWVGLPDGSEWLADSVRGRAEGLGLRCAGRLRAAGADELLRRSEREAAA